MKNKLIYFFSALIILSLGACKSDDNPSLITLNYDADNLASPSLPAGSYEASARFPSGALSAANGGTLEEVEVYIQELPNTAQIKIYSSNGGLEPTDLLYTAEIANSLQSNSWNTHTLNSDLTIDGSQDLWVCVAFSQSGDARVIGCDPGPAVVNGDWLFDTNDNQWSPLRVRTSNSVDINWNIRAIVSPLE